METNKPQAPPLPTATLPQLRNLNRWVVWKWEWNGKKWTKPPYALTATPTKEGWNLPGNQLTFDQALAAAKGHGFDGVGFVFNGDEYIGIDFDNCIADGVIHPAVRNWLDNWFSTTYWEISPSGTGIHVLCRGKLAQTVTAHSLPGAEGVMVEAYSNGRYFTFTGRALDTTVPSLENVQDFLDKLLKHIGVNGNEPEYITQISAIGAKRHYEKLTEMLRNAPDGNGNNMLNHVAWFAGRAEHALGKSEAQLKADLLQIVCEDWQRPMARHEAETTINSGWNGASKSPLEIIEASPCERLVAEMNQKYFLVMNYGGKRMACWLEEDPDTVRLLRRNPDVWTAPKLKFVHQKEREFEGQFRNTKIEVPGVKIKDDGEKVVVTRIKTHGQAWLDSPDRRCFDSVVFAPGRVLPDNIKNLWRGFAYEPKPGDCSLYLNHLRDNICRGDAVKYDWLIRRIAYIFQRLDEKIPNAIVILGKKGVGKTKLAEVLTELLGQHGMIVSNERHVTGNFNAHLRDKIILVSDEALFAGNRQHERILKNMISSETILIEPKGVDTIDARNHLNLIIIGNDRWLVPASDDERRYFVLECGDAQRENHAYFAAIDKQLKNGGYAALLHYLLNVDLAGFNPRAVPDTDELQDQKIGTLRGVELAWWECLENGELPGELLGETALLSGTTFIEQISKSHRQELLGANVKTLGFLFRSMGFDVKTKGTSRLNYWQIPTLQECRNLWDKKKSPVKWTPCSGWSAAKIWS